MNATKAIPGILCVLSLCGLLIANVWLPQPRYNWDMLGYLAVVHQLSGDSPPEIHRKVYAEVKEVVAPERYESLTRSTGYREQMEKSVTAFAEQQPFYSVKPAYPLVVKLLVNWGYNPVRATVLVSRLAYLLVGIVLLWWLSEVLGIYLATFAAWMICSLPFAIELARLSTPDALSTLFVVASAFLLSRARDVAGCSLLAASVLVRPDNIIWSFLAVGYQGLVRRTRTRTAAISFMAALAGYLYVSWLSGNYGWKTLFYVHFVERFAFPAQLDADLSLAQIGSIYLKQSHPVNLPQHLLLFVLLGAGVLALRSRSKGWRDHWSALVAVGLAYALLHWLAFPAEQRHLAAFYLICIVALVFTGIDQTRFKIAAPAR